MIYVINILIVIIAKLKYSKINLYIIRDHFLSPPLLSPLPLPLPLPPPPILAAIFRISFHISFHFRSFSFILFNKNVNDIYFQFILKNHSASFTFAYDPKAVKSAPRNLFCGMELSKLVTASSMADRLRAKRWAQDWPQG